MKRRQNVHYVQHQDSSSEDFKDTFWDDNRMPWPKDFVSSIPGKSPLADAGEEISGPVRGKIHLNGYLKE